MPVSSTSPVSSSKCSSVESAAGAAGGAGGRLRSAGSKVLLEMARGRTIWSEDVIADGGFEHRE
jgi:hypothetical protein